MGLGAIMLAMETIHPHVKVSPEQIAGFCRKWQITRFELFGSVVREDFDAASDIDVLVTFAPAAKITISKLLMMEEELQATFGRKVDIVERKAIEGSANWIRRRRILESARLVYAAA